MKRCPQCNRVETDEALKFCRIDGATLIDDATLGGEAGTAQLVANASEVHTSILPHNTSANANRTTGPTTVLPLPSTPATGAIAKLRKRTTAIIAAVIVTAAFAAVTAIAVNIYLAKKSNAAIESVAVLPFENRS